MVVVIGSGDLNPHPFLYTNLPMNNSSPAQKIEITLWVASSAALAHMWSFILQHGCIKYPCAF
jgi:hypothetical protein